MKYSFISTVRKILVSGGLDNNSNDWDKRQHITSCGKSLATYAVW